MHKLGGSRTGLFPKDPLVATGDNLTFSCNHTFDSMSSGETVKDLYFIFNNIPYNATSPQFTILDENTAQLHLLGLQRNFTHKHVYCYLDTLQGQTTIQVLGMSISILTPPIPLKYVNVVRLRLNNQYNIHH